jgi:VIT1/CCC1 family predicted Fe2+/Mn2+ transporter
LQDGVLAKSRHKAQTEKNNMKISHVNPAGFPGLLIVISVMVGFFSLFPLSTAIWITVTLASTGMSLAILRVVLAKRRSRKKVSGILGL